MPYRYTDPTGLHPHAGQGISNDQTASRHGRARLRLQALLPQGAAITVVHVTKHVVLHGYTVSEYYLFTIHDGHIALLNPYLRDLAFGVNRKRGTIRTADTVYQLVELIGQRVYGDRSAFELIDIDPALP